MTLPGRRPSKARCCAGSRSRNLNQFRGDQCGGWLMFAPIRDDAGAGMRMNTADPAYFSEVLTGNVMVSLVPAVTEADDDYG